MTPAETAAILRQFNEWRRADDYILPQPAPREVGEAIDAAVEMIERLEEAESDAFEQARLNGMGASREAALLAKLEAAEKERDNANAAAAGIALQAETLQAERDALRAELAQLHKEADQFGDGIDWIQRALQAEAKIAEMEKQEPLWFIDERGEPKRYHKRMADYCKCGGLDLLYALPGAKGE